MTFDYVILALIAIILALHFYEKRKLTVADVKDSVAEATDIAAVVRQCAQCAADVLNALRQHDGTVLCKDCKSKQ